MSIALTCKYLFATESTDVPDISLQELQPIPSELVLVSIKICESELISLSTSKSPHESTYTKSYIGDVQIP